MATTPTPCTVAPRRGTVRPLLLPRKARPTPLVPQDIRALTRATLDRATTEQRGSRTVGLFLRTLSSNETLVW